jgi:N-6 DNA Methylase.
VVETLFRYLDDSATLLQKELDCSYLEALVETGDNAFQNEVQQNGVSEVTKKRLEKIYEEMNRLSYTREDIRKAFQLACLKGMREKLHPNRQMTPDTIGILFSFFLEKLLNGPFSIFDPAIGTGNLLTTILNRLPNDSVKAFGADADDLLIKLAYVNANLQEHPIQLYNQDSLKPLFVDPVDVVVCDLPAGYYTDDEQAKEYELRAREGHSYAPFLFIEQSIRYTKPGGYLLFVIPNSLFEMEDSMRLHEFLKKTAYIQAVIQLPLSMFKNKNLAKSLFFLQKKKEGIRPPRQVLLANLPSFDEKNAMERIFSDMERWFSKNKQ